MSWYQHDLQNLRSPANFAVNENGSHKNDRIYAVVFRENSLCTECPLQIFINNLTEEEVHEDQKLK